MIAHVSLPADDCEKVARVLAEMLDGGALCFPPGGPDAWNCWSKENDFQIVVTPRDYVLVEGAKEQEWARREAPDRLPRGSESHVAICVPRSAREVLAIARGADWHARVCNRGGFFDLVEVWVENAYLVEVLDPSQAAAYRRTMTVANWKRAFDLA